MKRQAILDSLAPPDFWVLLDEAVVRRMVGGHEVMREQLAHVLERASSGSCKLQVIPFTAGSHQGLQNGFTILQFESTASSPEEAVLSGVVFLEASDGERYLDTDDVLAYHLSRFESMRAQALNTEETISLLRTVAAEI